MNALTFSSFGSSDVLEYRSMPRPSVGSSGVLIEMHAIGLNFADIYRRKGTYHLRGEKPFIAGYEGAGVVVESMVEHIQVGDRVSFADVPFAHAEYVAVPASHVIPLPPDISYATAASVLIQGLTAQYLAQDSHAVVRGETVVVHAAAGGVGQILTQICVAQGARVIGLTTSEHKKNIILQCGAQYALNIRQAWKEEILAITNQRGVDVVYDSVGSTLGDSIAITRECGHIVFYGMSGGDPAPVDPRMLMDGSKTLTGGDLWGYLTSREERLRRSDALFQWIRDGVIIIQPPKVFHLSEGKQAHDYLESGRSAGKVIFATDQYTE
jgi:NADPH:quinone reductase